MSEVIQPPRSTLVTWLRVNVMMLSLLFGFVSGGALAIWRAGIWYSDQQHNFAAADIRAKALTDQEVVLGNRLDGLGTRIEGLGTRLEGLGREISGLTGRTNGLADQEASLGGRIEGMHNDIVDVDRRLNELKGDARVAEERIKNIGERTQKGPR